MRFTFEEDYIAGLLLQHDESMMKDILMWGADYPHPQGVWPNFDAVMDRLFAGIDDGIRQEVLFGHCLRFFNLKSPDARTHGLAKKSL